MLVTVYGSKKDKVGGDLELCSVYALTIITGLAYSSLSHYSAQGLLLGWGEK
jgi:hypothetical protein